MKRRHCSYTLYKQALLFCLLLIVFNAVSAQTPVTQIGYIGNNVSTQTEASIKGAGYSFSQWTTASNFNINYATTSGNDILSIVSFTAAGNTFIPITLASAVTKAKRVANGTIKDDRNFITYWNKCSAFPAAGATSGTFNCDAPKITSMEVAMSGNNINSGYDNIFNNTPSDPHYGNVERLDYIAPNGFIAINTPDKAGFVVFDRGVGDDFKMAAITAVDASGNPTAYKTLITVPASKFSASGLLQSPFDYVIFVSDPDIASGESRPSTKSNQNIKGVYISMADLGIAVNETIYGYSLFGQDVDPSAGHVLTDPTTFPVNSSFASCLDPLNVFTLFQSGIVVLPVKLNSFNGFYNRRNKAVDLKWSTSNEQGLNYFNIEKSSNSTDWSRITKINASGNTDGRDYFFTDNNLQTTPKLYYRLKMVNSNGSFQYSNIAYINHPSEKEINLITGETSLIIKTDIDIKTARLIDLSGKDVQPEKNKIPGVDIEFSLTLLPSGIYIVVLSDVNNKSYSKKFMKL
ncbi:MAG: T9SS type A sorting domain-containing protein [Ferruginibacter sp.]